MENNTTATVLNIVATRVRRTVNAYQSGVGRKTFETEAANFGELKQELLAQGYNLNNVKVTEGNSYITLENDEALLPTNIPVRGNYTNDLVIVMTPITKIKSGLLDLNTATYREMKAVVKELFNSEETKAEAREFFGNYTQMGLIDMKNKLEVWYSVHTPRACNGACCQDRLREVQKNLETGEFFELEGTFDEDMYQEGVKHIQHGLLLISNAMRLIEQENTITDADLEALANKFA